MENPFKLKEEILKKLDLLKDGLSASLNSFDLSSKLYFVHNSYGCPGGGCSGSCSGSCYGGCSGSCAGGCKGSCACSWMQ